MVEYNSIHFHKILSIKTTYNNKFLFTSDNYGSLKQWSIPHCKIHKDFPKAHSKTGISTILITRDDEYLVTGDL